MNTNEESQPISDEQATFDPETGELTIQIDKDDIGLLRLAILYADQFESSQALSYTIRRYVADHIEEMRDVEIDLFEPEDFQQHLMCPRSEKLAEQANELYHSLTHKANQLDDMRDEIRNVDVDAADALTERISEIREQANLAHTLTEFVRQNPFGQLFL